MFKTSGKERATNHAPSVVTRAVPAFRAISAHVPLARDIARAVIIDLTPSIGAGKRSISHETPPTVDVPSRIELLEPLLFQLAT